MTTTITVRTHRIPHSSTTLLCFFLKHFNNYMSYHSPSNSSNVEAQEHSCFSKWLEINLQEWVDELQLPWVVQSKINTIGLLWAAYLWWSLQLAHLQIKNQTIISKLPKSVASISIVIVTSDLKIKQYYQNYLIQPPFVSPNLVNILPIQQNQYLVYPLSWLTKNINDIN